jgi:plasmid stability protein
MPDISIKNVPERILVQLKAQARKNQRSLQRELMIILETAVEPTRMSLEELNSLVTASGLRTGSESVEYIREDRDAR